MDEKRNFAQDQGQAPGQAQAQAQELGLAPADAQTYAGWFKALADPMRVQLLNLLARERRPMAVGDIADRLPIGQSTVSHHLKVLAEVRFVLPERHGTSVRYEVNAACLECFPAAVDAILGRQP